MTERGLQVIRHIFLLCLLVLSHEVVGHTKLTHYDTQTFIPPLLADALEKVLLRLLVV